MENSNYLGDVSITVDECLKGDRHQLDGKSGGTTDDWLPLVGCGLKSGMARVLAITR